MARENTPGRVTRLLAEASAGSAAAADELLPLVYEELRRLARLKLARERPGQTLPPTALVHEAYLRLVGDPGARFSGRGHFFAAAAEAMRRILVERARRRARQRHGGDWARTTLAEDSAVVPPRPEELLALDDALTRLETQDRDMGAVVKLRYFAGLTVPETAEALGLSPRSVNRLWAGARAWLYREMTREPAAAG